MNHEEKILGLLENLTTQVGQMSTRVDQMSTQFEQMNTRVDQLTTRVDKMAVQFDQMSTQFDQMNTRVDQLTTRVDQLTTQVGQMNELLQEVNERSLRTAVTQENKVLPQLSLLYEGHETLLDSLAPKEQVEELEEQTDIVKNVVTSLSQRVAALERAAL